MVGFNCNCKKPNPIQEDKDSGVWICAKCDSVIPGYKPKLSNEEYLINCLAYKCGKEMVVNDRKVKSLNCIFAQMSIFILMKRLEEKGINLKIPYYWDAYGVRLELNTLVEMYPNIKWSCLKEEFEKCPYKNDCNFKYKYPVSGD